MTLGDRLSRWRRWGSCVLEVACHGERHHVRIDGLGRVTLVDHHDDKTAEAVMTALGAAPASSCHAVVAAWSVGTTRSLPVTAVMFEVRRHTDGALLRVQRDWRLLRVPLKQVLTVLEPD